MTRHNRDGGAGSPRHYELGRTDSARELVPGSPAALHGYAGDLREATGTHRTLAAALREAPISSWTGEAADAFIDTAVALVRRYEAAADATGLAARTIDTYADGLAQAQRHAGEAIDLYDGTARHSHGDRDAARASSHGGDPQARRDEARQVLDRARAHLAALAQDTRIQIRRASDMLPASTPLLAPSDGGGSPHTAPASRDAPAPPSGGRTITVRRGDTLSGIAERVLGDASRWPEIAELNRDVITDPDLIFPGQRLVLPATGDDGPRDRDSDEERDDRGSHGSDRCEPPRDDRHGDDRPPRNSQDDDRYPNEPAPRDSAPRDSERSPERSDAPPQPIPPPAAPAPTPAPPTPPAPTPDGTTAPTPQGPPEATLPRPTPPQPAPAPEPSPEPPPPTQGPSADPLPPFYPDPAFPEPDLYDIPPLDPPPSTSNEPVPDQPAPPPADPEPPPVDPPTAENAPAPAPPAPSTTDPGTPSAPDNTAPDPGTDGPTPNANPDTPPDAPAEPDPRSSPSLVANEGNDPGAIDLGTGLFVVGAVGAVAAAAVLLARRGDTAAGRTGTGADSVGRRSSVLPPVVRQLGNAYLRARHADAPRPAAPATSPPTRAGALTPPARQRVRFALPIGRTPEDGPAHIDLAAHPALALRGDRLADITRAILLACLSPPGGQPTAGPPAHVVIPAADAAYLLDDLPSLPTPSGLHIVDDIDAAIDELERGPRERSSPPVVLIATAPPAQSDPAERLQQILTARRRRVAAVLLGDWPTPATIHATPAAAVHGNTTFPTLPIGTRLFTTSLPDARDLLAALTAPHPSTDQPDAGPERAEPDHAEPTDPPTIPIPIAGPANTGDDQHEDPDTNAPTPKPAPDDHANPDPADPEPDSGADTTNTTTPAAAADVAPTEPQTRASGKALTIEVFGRLRVNVNVDGASTVDITSEISDRRRELLTYLAVHPAGARRDLIINDLWADSNARSPADNLHSAIHRLRIVFAEYVTDAPIILGPEDDHYQLNPTQVDVDYWRFEAAATRHHTAGTDTERTEAARQIISLYKEDLASALTTAWIEPFRAQAQRVAIDASDSLARHLYRSGETDQAIGVLEHATTAIAPYTESLYQLLIQLQRKQGRPKAAERTLETLTTRLASIDLQPSAATVALVRSPTTSSMT